MRVYRCVSFEIEFRDMNAIPCSILDTHTHGCIRIRIYVCAHMHTYTCRRVHAQSILFDLLAEKSMGNGAHMCDGKTLYTGISRVIMIHRTLHVTGQCFQCEPLYAIARENVLSQRSCRITSDVCVNNIRQIFLCNIE